MQQGRSQARQLVVAAVDQPPSMYAEALQQLGAGAAPTRVVDLYSDPYGWQQQAAEQAAEQGQQRGAAEPLPLEQLQQMLLQQRQGQPGGGGGAPGPSAAAGSSADGAAAAGHQLCIVIDSLSTLLMRYPMMQVGRPAGCLAGGSQPPALLQPQAAPVQLAARPPRLTAPLRVPAGAAAAAQPGLQPARLLRPGAASRRPARRAAAGVAAAPG
jgi:hypothetical protein